MTEENVAFSGPRIQDLSGKSFCDLTALRIGPKKSGRIAWVCKCQCGNEVLVIAKDLKSGNTRSCGCLKAKLTSERSRTHGESKQGNGGKESPEYKTWCHIIDRCCNANAKAYPDYGGRGITVCERWRNSYEAFLEDMGRKPSKSHTIDRIRNNEGYEPGNCRWATRADQNRNTRANVLITFQGETKVMSEWARTVGITPRTLSKRLKRGWSIEKALSNG